MSKVFIERINERRKDLDLSLDELAATSGVGVSILKQVVSGRAMTSVKNFESIAEALNCEVEYIYDENYKDTKIISIANNKGGSGKTSIAVNLSHALSTLGYSVLLIDSDMQMNSTKTFKFQRDKEKSIYVAFDKGEDLTGYIKNTEYENLDMIISDYDMAMAELMLFTKIQRETLFINMIAPVKASGKYDFIIIDTNPTLGIVNLNCMGASDYALIPVELSKFGIDGLNTLTNFFRSSILQINPNFRVLGVLFNKVDKRENLTEIATEIINEVFGDHLLETYIPVDASIKKAQWEQVPILAYNANTKAGKVSLDLAKEVLSIVK